MTKALVVGVGEFGRPGPAGESADATDPGTATTSLRPLPAVAPAVRELASALARAGASTGEALVGCTSTEFAAAWLELRRPFESEEPLIVHFAGHGVVSAASNTLFLATSDLQEDSAALHATGVSVSNLLVAAVDARRPVLLLLDVCGAGKAVEAERLHNLLTRQPQDADPNVWIIGASASRALAFGARFTTATVEVLHRLADGDLDISPREEYVPFTTLAQAVHRQLAATDSAAGRYVQDVVHSPLARAAPETPPFLRNPAHRPGARADRLPGLHPALRGLAEACTPGLDPVHFGGRVAGARDVDAILFSGRAAQLARIQDWTFAAARRNRLLVVTGGPGSGKSALLGVTACLLHPELDGFGNSVAAVVDGFYPRQPETVLAVHARQLTLRQITDSLAQQLRARREPGAPGAHQPSGQPPGHSPQPPPKEHRTPGSATAALLEELAGAGDVLVILDALDEAVDPASVLGELLLPLATGPDTAGCRLLLGTRPWWDALPALRRHLAAHPEAVLDLDPRDAGERRALAADLDGYLRGLLRPRARDARERVRAIARRLSEYTDHGAFLVAAVYAEHLRTTPSAEAAQPPCGVTEVFDLHCGSLAATDPWIRPVLDVLGRARGQGMPLDLLHAAALAHRPPDLTGPTPQLADTRRVLGKAAFHTRTAVDTDQRLLYRYFHQSLADHTAARTDPAVFHQALLATLPTGQDGARDWTYAHPYLLRHAAEHAAEAGAAALRDLLLNHTYLGAADLERLLPLALRRIDGEGHIGAHGQIIRHAAHRTALLADRSGQGALLALAALHLGLDEERDAFGGVRPRGLRSVWATTAPRRLGSLPVQPGPVVSLDAAVVRDPEDGRPREIIVTACDDGWVRVWDARLTTLVAEVDMAPSRPVGVRLAGPPGAELTVLDAAFGIWRGDVWGRDVLTRTGRAFPEPEGQRGTWMARAVEGRAANRLHIVWGRRERESETRVAELDLDVEDSLVGSALLGRSTLREDDDSGLFLRPYGGGRLPLAASAGDAPVAAVGNPLLDEVWLLDIEGEAAVAGRVPMGPHQGVRHCRTLLCGRLNGVPVAVTGDYMGEISIRTVASSENTITFSARPAHTFTGHFLGVEDLAITTVAGREVLLSSGTDGAVHLWDPEDTRGARRPAPFAGAIAGLAVATLTSPEPGRGRHLVVAGDTAGNWGVTCMGSGRPVHGTPPRREGEVTGVATAVLPVAGTPRPLGVVCSTDQSIRLMDLETGEAVGRPFGGIVESMGARCEWTAVTAGSLAGRSVVVGAATGHYRRHRYNTLYVFAAEDWSDTAARETLVEPLFGTVSGHRGPIPCVTLGTVGGRDILVTGSADGHVRVWDGSTFERSAPPLETGSASVLDLWLGELRGREVILAVCGDGTLRRWDARTFESLGEPVAAHTGEARGVGVAVGEHGPVVVTTGLDGLVRTWDPATWNEYGPAHPLLHPGTALDCAGPTVMVASGVTLVRLDLDGPPG
ncbi:hypothetical protein [Streptomyces sp. fd1-xmd]|uniref:hypothetical protein n=1 Tax=Streptomyces sp. fd1-xmd TaxID=1812480 RepID=UPI00099074FD|nr:hypothetical protein [Streptomyces sp. fd1-xmd]AQT76104.1 hypothetical protein B1K54_34960 [Streptomyces sp. fd1-xmd]